jgi:DNA adenine methylase
LFLGVPATDALDASPFSPDAPTGGIEVKNEDKDLSRSDQSATPESDLRDGDRGVTLPPLLKWAGGKRWQVPHIAPLWLASGATRLVEPFCGGLSVALGLQPKRAWLNDTNPHLMNFYFHVREGSIAAVPTENTEVAFYHHRDRFNELARTTTGTYSPEAAALFFYLNHTGFNGLCRFNSKGGFNVPYGKRKTVKYERDWKRYAKQFDEWFFVCGDFARNELRSGDFVYADPPYDVEFTTYSAGGFKWADQVRAAEWLAKHDGPVVLVNQQTPRIEALYRSLGFDLGYLDAPRRISCNGDRTPAKEVFATRNIELRAGTVQALSHHSATPAASAAQKEHSQSDSVVQP